MSSTQADVLKELQTRMSLGMILEKQRSVAVEGPVREQFEAELRELTEAEQDSKELKSAKRNLLYDRITAGVKLPFTAADAESGRAGRVHAGLHPQGVRRDLQEPRPAQDRDRQAAARRPLGGDDPGDRMRGHGHTACARLGALHAGADADHDPADPRHPERGPADRRPVAGARPPLHAPLQLPAVLRR